MWMIKSKHESMIVFTGSFRIAKVSIRISSARFLGFEEKSGNDLVQVKFVLFSMVLQYCEPLFSYL